MKGAVRTAQARQRKRRQRELQPSQRAEGRKARRDSPAAMAPMCFRGQLVSFEFDFHFVRPGQPVTGRISLPGPSRTALAVPAIGSEATAPSPSWGSTGSRGPVLPSGRCQLQAGLCLHHHEWKV